jgi:N-acetylmuramoyl-L-alanine amidase
VAALSRDIIGRHDIEPRHVLAHSDIAPGRKIDPGEKFDWKGLAAVGVGQWVPPSDLDATDEGLTLESRGDAIAEAQHLLALYGYKVETHGVLDEATQTVLKAFQLHFRQARPDGRLDRSTLDTLQRLASATQKSPEAIG